MQLFLQQIVEGLASGAIYASLALALVLIYRATRIVNFAQGEMATLSVYLAWQLTQWGVPFWLSLIDRRGAELRDGRAGVPPDDPAGARRLGSHHGGDLHRLLRRLRGDLPVVLGRGPARVPAPLSRLRLDHRRRAADREQSRHPGDAVRADRGAERAVPLHPHRACDARLGGRAREEPAGRHSGRDHADVRLGPCRDGRLHRGGADRAERCSSRRR